MADRKTAIMWTLAWWFARRYTRRRAAAAVSGVTAAASARKGRLLTGVGVFALVGLLVGLFFVWRRLFARADVRDALPDPVETDGAAVPSGLA